MIKSPRRIHDLLTQHAAMQPEAEAAVENDTRLSYVTLASRVDLAAAALLATGVKPGDRVATLAPPGLHFWITYLATTSIGAIWVGLNPRYRERDYQYLLTDAKPKVVFIQSPYDGRAYDAELQALENSVDTFVTFGEPAGKAQPWDEFLNRSSEVSSADLDRARSAVKPEDTAVIVYTSGTTGAPKGAMLSQRAITKLAIMNAEWMGEGLTKTIMPAPINHIGGLNNVCMNVLAHGGCIVFYHRIDPAVLVKLILTEKPTYFVTSPTAFIMFLEAPGFTMDWLRSFKLIVYGGAKTPQSVLEKYQSLGAYMSSVYGQTECCGVVTRTRPEDSIEVMAETIGRPLDGIEMRVADAQTGRVCGVSEIGELQIRSDCVMTGYFNQPVATREAFTVDGFLRTGDLCVKREDGNFKLVGRIKEMFKSGGYNVYPLEIEQAICEHPKVSVAAVLSMPDAKFQEVGFAFVAPKPGAALVEDELREFLRQRIANYKVPKVLRIEAVLPLLPNSKIDKQALKQRLNEFLTANEKNESLHA